MPVDLPPPKKPIESIIASPGFPSARTLNWLAVVVGIGLCLWAVNYGLVSPPGVNSPSNAPVSSSPKN
jgi:hypothetical protein